jgi:hypothetical protein
LVVNIGVRYDYHSVPTERDGRLFNLTDLGYGPLRPADSIYNADYVIERCINNAIMVQEMSSCVKTEG